MSTLTNEFSWSFSRHGTLETCPRRYFYRYYGHWGGWAEDAPEKARELYRLGKLDGRALWAGKVVHDGIARALWRARDGRAVVDAQDVDDFMADVLHQMRQDFKDSRGDVARRTGRIKWHVRFAEHEFDVDDGSPAWRARWKETADQVEKGLRNFLGSHLHGELRELPAADWIELEDPAKGMPPSFTFEGVKVWARIDCAYRADGKPTLIDWKTGRRLSPAGSVQLATYALYMRDAHGIEPTDLVAREINVVTGQSIEHDVGPRALEEFRAVFLESVEGIRTYLVNGDTAKNEAKPEEEWPVTSDAGDCRFCNFRAVCPGPSA